MITFSSTNTPVHQATSTTDYDAYTNDASEQADVPPPVPTTPPPTVHQNTFTREVTTLISSSAQQSGAYANGDNDDDNAANDDAAHEPRFDLTAQKEQLCQRIAGKLAALADEQTAIADEQLANERLGVEVAAQVAEKIRAVDVSRFRSYVDDVGHITMLLLSLSGRLARTENELQVVEVGDSERVSFLHA